MFVCSVDVTGSAAPMLSDDGRFSGLIAAVVWMGVSDNPISYARLLSCLPHWPPVSGLVHTRHKGSMETVRVRRRQKAQRMKRNVMTFQF